MIFCRSSNHARSADINLLNTLIDRGATSNCLNEWIEADNNKIKGGNSQFLKLIDVSLQAQIGKDSSMNHRV